MPLQGSTNRANANLAVAHGRQGAVQPVQLDPHESSAGDLEAILGRLMERLHLAVVFGGNRAEPGAVLNQTFNTRAWKSYEAVAQDIVDALRRLGFRHVSMLPDDMRLVDGLQREGAQMAWLNTAGVQGHNPSCHAPAMLEMLGIPYIGHDPLAVTILDNKHIFKRALIGYGLPTAPFMTWHMARGRFDPVLNSRFQDRFREYSGLYVVKPAIGRASMHVQVVDNSADLPDAIAQVHAASHGLVLIETYLEGAEYVVAASGPVTASQGRLRRRPAPFVFGAQERVLAPDERIFTSMDTSPITRSRIRRIDPRHDAIEYSRLHRLAETVYRDFDLVSLIRLDVRADKDGRIHVLEANPKPDLKRPSETVTSLVCEGLADYGMSYEDLILTLFADRIDTLLQRQRAGLGHIEGLLA
jgi:D-alanine-D-alanine ligase